EARRDRERHYHERCDDRDAQRLRREARKDRRALQGHDRLHREPAHGSLPARCGPHAGARDRDEGGHRSGGEARPGLPDGPVRANRLHRRGHQLPRSQRVLRRVQGSQHGTAAPASQDDARGTARDEDRQRLLRIRRAGEAQVLDPHEQVALKKAAIWSMVAGVAHVITAEFGANFFPSWYFALSAVGYGLLLPIVASLQVLHRPVRESGAILGTIAGASVVTLGLGAAANTDLIPAALFVR